ncbi:hypothetical protein [Sorangium sp. So ce693]|uniref:hypothetical protein n=1 Tax=Sorangium sp. So ce693 TaxID=3133318 RepID=UPI003F5DC8CC
MYALSAEAFDVPWHTNGRGARGSSSGAEDVVSLLPDGLFMTDRPAWALTANAPQLALNSEQRAAERAQPVLALATDSHVRGGGIPPSCRHEGTAKSPQEPRAAAGGSEDGGEFFAALSVRADMASGAIVYPRAVAFDLQRGADKDIAFGGDNHYCIGATLARLDVRLAIDTSLGRSPGWGSRDRPNWRGRPRSWR